MAVVGVPLQGIERRPVVLDELPVQTFKNLGFKQVRRGPIPAACNESYGKRSISPVQIIKMQNQRRVVGAQLPNRGSKGVGFGLHADPGNRRSQNLVLVGVQSGGAFAPRSPNPKTQRQSNKTGHPSHDQSYARIALNVPSARIFFFEWAE